MINQNWVYLGLITTRAMFQNVSDDYFFLSYFNSSFLILVQGANLPIVCQSHVPHWTRSNVRDWTRSQVGHRTNLRIKSYLQILNLQIKSYLQILNLQIKRYMEIRILNISGGYGASFLGRNIFRNYVIMVMADTFGTSCLWMVVLNKQ